jgi:hypothetical protein
LGGERIAGTLPMNLWSEDGPLTPALSPKGEREQTSRNLHRVQGFNARSFRGNLSPFGGEREPFGNFLDKLVCGRAGLDEKFGVQARFLLGLAGSGKTFRCLAERVPLGKPS